MSAALGAGKDAAIVARLAKIWLWLLGLVFSGAIAAALWFPESQPHEIL